MKQTHWIGLSICCMALALPVHMPSALMLMGGYASALADNRDHHKERSVEQDQTVEHGKRIEDKEDSAREKSAFKVGSNKRLKNPANQTSPQQGNGSVPVTPTPPPPAQTVDTTPPVVTPPPSLTVEATGITSTAVLGSATVSDNVNTGLIATASNAGPFPLGTTMLTWTATDAAGNTGTATQAVTVVDTTPPVLTLPPDVVVDSVNNQPVSIAIGAATATDIFVPITISNNAPATFPVGVTQVTWTSTDANGNASTGIQRVTVNASVLPTVSSPPAVSMEATGVQTVVPLGVATATDAAGNVLAVSSNAPASFPVGVSTVIYSATDAQGNTASAMQTVRVIDTTPPTISLQRPAITIEAVSPQVTVVLGTVSSSDLVDGPLTPTNNAPPVFSLGVTQVVWSATDTAGNTGTATQNVVVQDSTPPLVTAPPAVTADSATGQPIAVSIGTATASDAFTPVTISSDAPASFPVGATTVTWTATDSNGNSATAIQTVTVNDTSVLAGLPPDPGAAGMATLEGIDSDADGVRDDVQRWIAMTYPHSQKTRASLNQMAIAMQAILINSANATTARKYSLSADKAADCISYVRESLLGANSDAYNLKREMEANFLNTALRSKAWLMADSYLSGMMFGVPNDLKQGCNFDPDLMPN